mgnify:CR=1 FL=1
MKVKLTSSKFFVETYRSDYDESRKYEFATKEEAEMFIAGEEVIDMITHRSQTINYEECVVNVTEEASYECLWDEF